MAQRAAPALVGPRAARRRARGGPSRRACARRRRRRRRSRRRTSGCHRCRTRPCRMRASGGQQARTLMSPARMRLTIDMRFNASPLAEHDGDTRRHASSSWPPASARPRELHASAARPALGRRARGARPPRPQRHPGGRARPGLARADFALRGRRRRADHASLGPAAMLARATATFRDCVPGRGRPRRRWRAGGRRPRPRATTTCRAGPAGPIRSITYLRSEPSLRYLGAHVGGAAAHTAGVINGLVHAGVGGARRGGRAPRRHRRRSGHRGAAAADLPARPLAHAHRLRRPAGGRRGAPARARRDLPALRARVLRGPRARPPPRRSADPRVQRLGDLGRAPVGLRPRAVRRAARRARAPQRPRRLARRRRVAGAQGPAGGRRRRCPTACSSTPTASTSSGWRGARALDAGGVARAAWAGPRRRRSASSALSGSWHGVRVLPEIIDAVRAARDDVRWIVVGAGALFDEVRADIERRGLADARRAHRHGPARARGRAARGVRRLRLAARPEPRRHALLRLADEALRVHGPRPRDRRLRPRADRRGDRPRAHGAAVPAGRRQAAADAVLRLLGDPRPARAASATAALEEARDALQLGRARAAHPGRAPRQCVASGGWFDVRRRHRRASAARVSWIAGGDRYADHDHDHGCDGPATSDRAAHRAVGRCARAARTAAGDRHSPSSAAPARIAGQQHGGQPAEEIRRHPGSRAAARQARSGRGEHEEARRAAIAGGARRRAAATGRQRQRQRAPAWRVAATRRASRRSP